MPLPMRRIDLDVSDEVVAMNFGGEGVAMFSVDELYTFALERSAFLPEESDWVGISADRAKRVSTASLPERTT